MLRFNPTSAISSPSTPLAILQPRTAIAWQFAPNSVLRTGFGLFSDILPGSVADAIGMNPPYVQTFQGGLLGTVGGAAIAPGVPNSAVDATRAANQAFGAGFAQGELSCASSQANPSACLQPVALAAVPGGTLHPPYFMEWSLGIEHQFGTTTSVRAQYVGTRALDMPYLTQVNGYQTVCQGCFAPFPYLQPADPRFAAVTQFSTGANSHYNGLQLTAMKRLGTRSRRARLTTISAVAWIPSRTADSCRFRRVGLFHRSRAIWLAIMALATTTSGTTSMPNMSISSRSKCGVGNSVTR